MRLVVSVPIEVNPNMIRDMDDGPSVVALLAMQDEVLKVVGKYGTALRAVSVEVMAAPVTTEEDRGS